MRSVEALPHAVRTLDHVWIPMPDGTRLAARIWLPATAEQQPVPAVLEYVPYRHRDNTALRDSRMHPYFAGHGYAALRVDLRGSGNSEGILRDEYLPQELEDGLAILRWLASQPWCNGSIGMIGISWGGFNALQLAALAPPELRAVITVCSSDDRYRDDVHYMGGCLLGDNLSWAAVMFSHTSCPPDPIIVGQRWRDMWLARLEHSGFWLENWLEHQHRDAFWRHGSICEDYTAVRCPVLAVSGWADGYTNSVFRLLAHLEVPRKGLVGPWGHKYPHQGVPGPAIGFLQECVRWWDHWLQGRDRGVMDEPMLRVWMQDSVPPTTTYAERPGRWVSEPSWPSPHIHSQRWILAAHGLLPEGSEVSQTPHTVQSPLSVGLFAGKWCSFTATPDLPHDQREEDGGALIFDSERLAAPLEILGSPYVELELMADQPVAMVAVRLGDVAPNHAINRVTFGMLNLTHRDGHLRPMPLVPHRRYRVRLRLNDIAHVFPRGHAIRVAFSTSYWPLAWPAPRPARITLFAGISHLVLPVRPPRPEDPQLRGFAEPEGAPPARISRLEPQSYAWRVIRELDRDQSTLEVVKDEGGFRLEDIDLEVRSKSVERYTYARDDLSSARGTTYWKRSFRRGAWDVATITRTELRCDAESFYLHADLDAYENGRRVHCSAHERAIRRNLL